MLTVTLVVVGALCWGAAGAMWQMGDGPSEAAECTALALDRDLGQTYAVPCTGVAPPLPSTLTALLPGSLPDDVAAAR